MSHLATDGAPQGRPSLLAGQVEQYLNHLIVERGLSTNTISAYRRDLGRYVAFCEQHGVQRAQDVTADVVASFGAELVRTTPEQAALSAASVSRIISSVRGFHRFLLLEQVTATDPSHDVKPQVPKRRLPKALTVDQVVAMLNAPNPDDVLGIRDRALLEFLYGTGARISEVLDLDVDDIDRDAPVVRLKGKGGKQRLVPVGSHARHALDTYLVRARPALIEKSKHGQAALFLNASGGRLSRQSAWLVIKKAAEAAHITSTVSPHVMRHSFATHLLDGGADVRVVQELLGHASVATTQIYTMVTIDRLREVYATSHPRALSK
mgnify:FL=1